MLKFFKLKLKFISLIGILFVFSSKLYANDVMPPDSLKQFIKHAVVYALENKNSNMDYSKYVSKNFVNLIDGNTFNYQQWVTHQKHVKAITKSMRPTFGLMLAQGNHVATIFTIDLIKNDNSHLTVKDLAFFTVKNKKIIYCEELTRLIKGNLKDKNIGSTK